MEHAEELHKKKEVLRQLQTQQQIAFEKFRVAFVEDERLSKVPVLIQILEQTERPAASANTTGLTKRYESLSTAKKTLTETLKQFDGLVEVSNLLQDSTKSEKYILCFLSYHKTIRSIVKYYKKLNYRSRG